MRIAFARRGPLADLRSVALTAALLGLPASLALPAARALASAGGASAQAATSSTAPATTETTADSTTTTTTTTDTSTGGAAPTGSQPRKGTLATWFGPGFYGHTTACGQTLTPGLVGVASRTLACGTLVQISYRGHQLTVPVLDRGPYGRIDAAWDLTAGAARALKITETVRIATEIVGSVPNTPLLGQPPESSSSESSTTPAAAGATSSAAASTTGGATAN
jgi:rare lipoprotein A (peptidoglycan hydrolase)